VQILRELKATGLALHALSNWSAEKFELVRPRLDFLDCFDSILLSGQVRLAKPDPRIYQVLLERIKTPAPDCLFIDDSAQNIATAGSLGFRWIHFSSPEGLRKDLVNLGLLNGKG
jgi:2-haloacid dehalogenase